MLSLRAGHLFAPLPDLLAWLEAISLGLQRGGWTLDEEFQRVHFDIHDAAPQPIFGRRSDLVRAFDGALRDFVTSDRYRPTEWERLSLGDQVREKTGQDPAIRVEALLAAPLSRRELQKQFWRIHGGTTVIAFVTDPDGYKIELIQRAEHGAGGGLRRGN